jgi:hypothetical protein
VSDHVIIKSADRGAVLELFAPSSAVSFRAHLRGEGFDGTVEVYDYQPPVHLAAFFQELAQHWRGWSGEKHWESLEHQLSLTASSDSTGNIHLAVELRGGPLYDWRLRGSLVLEPGQLDAVAAEVESFVRLTHAA